MGSNAVHIRELLSDHKDSIDQLMAEDKEFRALCDDYDTWVDALHYWISSEEPGAETRVGDYRDLIRALFEEISQILEKKTKRKQE